MGHGLTANSFSGLHFETLVNTRVDNTVNFPALSNVVESVVIGNPCSIRWTGYVQSEYSEEYTFYLRHYDGARLYVNGILMVDSLATVPHVSAEQSALINLVAGQSYSIIVEYADNDNSGECVLLWSSDSLEKEVIPTEHLFPVILVPFLSAIPTLPGNVPTISLSGS